MTDDDTTWKEFQDTVNMAAGELDKWLRTEPSRSIGQKKGDGESIVAILKGKRSDLTSDDCAHMRKVVGYAKWHLAQRPSGDIHESAWRCSPMNWGHDPTQS
jgi:hypothetical protein